MKNRNKAALCVLLVIIALSVNVSPIEKRAESPISEDCGQFQGQAFIDPVLNETQANTNTTNGQWYPSVSALTVDTFAVAWHSYGQDGSGYGVYAATFNATTGANLTPEFRVNAYTTSSQDYPSVSALSADTFAVAWDSSGQDGSFNGVYAAVFNATTGANLTPEFRVNAYTTSDQQYPSVSALGADTFAVAWTSTGQDGSGDGVYAAVFNATTGANLTPEFQVNAYWSLDQRYPSVSALGADTFVVAWMSDGQDGNGWGVYAAAFNATSGANLTPEFRVNAYWINHQRFPSVSALSADTFVVAWGSGGQDGSGYGVYAATFNATTGANLTPEFRVNAYTPDSQFFPSVSALSADTFVVAWTSDGQDGSGWGVYAAAFNATTGANLTPEFQVNAYTPDTQAYPSVSALTVDTFAVAWHSYGQDGSNYGIFFRALLFSFAPTLYPISPNPSVNGTIQLTWSAEPMASWYHVFRATAPITSVTGLIPITTTTETNYTDTRMVNGEYFYVVVAESTDRNSTISNCESVTVLFPLAPPFLYPIFPLINEDGTVELNWSVVENATTYYLYRETSFITSTAGLTPVRVTNMTNYTDHLTTDGYYYYAVVAGDGWVNSSVSNCFYIVVIIGGMEAPPDYIWLSILIVGFAVTGAIIVHGMLTRARRSVPPPPKKLPPAPKPKT